MTRAPRRTGLGVACAAGCLLAAAPARGGPAASTLFRAPAVRQISISPSGAHLASVRRQRGLTRIAIGRRDASREDLIQKRIVDVRRVAWASDRHLVTVFGSGPSYHVASVTHAGEEPAFHEERIRARGSLVHPLPQLGDDVLWAVRTLGKTHVYRLTVPELLQDDESSFMDEPGRRVAELDGKVTRWVADREAIPRAAFKPRGSDGGGELWYRRSADAPWRLIRRSEDESDVAFPLGMAENGVDLVVASRSGRDTLALLELSVETGELGRELFAHADADVVDVVEDYRTGDVIGAVYEQSGLPQFHYFDSFFDRYQRSLAHVFPDAVPILVSMSHDLRYFVVLVTSPRDPGTFYLLDTQENVATQIDRMMPWLDREELAPVEAIRLTSPDGIEIEAFLARPLHAEAKPPMVVLPHGGPWEVRDTRAFDPLVQFLAAGGMAVLQVNYRGSSGRGQEFLEAGKHQWGRGIEGDLEAAYDEVVGRGWVDGDRVCVAGGSYGGYSALMSVIRSPDRYRCAASLNAPLDLPYEFHFFFAHWERGRRYFEDVIADPDDPETLRALSPVYRVSELSVPVMLVQGSADRRVDVDHHYRMLNLLEALGKPHEAHVLHGVGHVPTPAEWVDIATRLRQFLSTHLEPG